MKKKMLLGIVTLSAVTIAITGCSNKSKITSNSQQALVQETENAVILEKENESTSSNYETGNVIEENNEDIVTGWQDENGKTYYHDEEGTQVKGWQQIDEKWFYFDNEDGAMKTGWIEDDGKSYYLADDGKMLHDTTIDGHYLTSDGSMAETLTNYEGEYFAFINGELEEPFRTTFELRSVNDLIHVCYDDAGMMTETDIPAYDGVNGKSGITTLRNDYTGYTEKSHDFDDLTLYKDGDAVRIEWKNNIYRRKEDWNKLGLYEEYEFGKSVFPKYHENGESYGVYNGTNFVIDVNDELLNSIVDKGNYYEMTCNCYDILGYTEEDECVDTLSPNAVTRKIRFRKNLSLTGYTDQLKRYSGIYPSPDNDWIQCFNITSIDSLKTVLYNQIILDGYYLSVGEPSCVRLDLDQDGYVTMICEPLGG